MHCATIKKSVTFSCNEHGNMFRLCDGLISSRNM